MWPYLGREQKLSAFKTIPQQAPLPFPSPPPYNKCIVKTGNQEPLEQRVLRLIREHRLVSGQQPLVVAVSGGPDSVCLLHILAGLRVELGISLHVAHLDHQLRGAESEADAHYVSVLAQQLGILRDRAAAFHSTGRISVIKAKKLSTCCASALSMKASRLTSPWPGRVPRVGCAAKKFRMN